MRKVTFAAEIAAMGLAALLVSCDTDPAGPFAATCPDPLPGDGMTLVTPNGCESYQVGDTMRITWRADSARSSVEVYLSSDNGMTFVKIGRVLPSEPSFRTGPLLWVITDSIWSDDGLDRLSGISDSCQVKIYDYQYPYFRDFSDAIFRIGPRK